MKWYGAGEHSPYALSTTTANANAPAIEFSRYHHADCDSRPEHVSRRWLLFKKHDHSEVRDMFVLLVLGQHHRTTFHQAREASDELSCRPKNVQIGSWSIRYAGFSASERLENRRA